MKAHHSLLCLALPGNRTLRFAAFALLGAGGWSAQASATAFDLEGLAAGYYHSVSVSEGGLTLTITPEGNADAFVWLSNNFVPLLGSVNASATLNNPAAVGEFLPLRFAFSSPLDSVTFNFGDNGGDDDTFAFVNAYDAGGNSLGVTFDSYPAGANAGASVTVNFPGASYYILSSGSVIGNPNSIGWDITSYTPAVVNNGAIPEPATWAMMLAGFAAVGFAMRKSKQPKVHFAF